MTARPPVPILMYHNVTARPSNVFREYEVTPKEFSRQMTWLRLLGYATISLDALLDNRLRGTALPPRPVIITFDDGFLDCFEYAFPILETHGYTAIFYLVASFVGRSSRWIIAELGIELPLMDWPAVRTLEAAGFACGAHTMSHPRLAQLRPEACHGELLQCREVLEDRLGHEVKHLAYPFGSYNARVQEIAAEVGYVSACTTNIGVSRSDDDCLALHRIYAMGHDSLLDFCCKLRTAQTARQFTRRRATGEYRRLRRTLTSLR